MTPLENHRFFVKTTLKSGSNTCEYSIFYNFRDCFFWVRAEWFERVMFRAGEFERQSSSGEILTRCTRSSGAVFRSVSSGGVRAGRG